MIRSPSPGPTSPIARLLVCGFGGFPGFADNPASAVLSRLHAEVWRPAATHVAYQLIPTVWAEGFEIAAQAMDDFEADGVLVLGVAGGAERFRIETRAHNRAAVDKPDAAGALHPSALIEDQGPAVVHATAPVQAMIAGIVGEGLPAQASDDAGDYLCNHVFYRLLTGGAARSIGFLHLPPCLSLDDLVRGAKAAAIALSEGSANARAQTFASGTR